MRSDWLDDSRKIPDETMSYIRKLVIDAIIRRNQKPAAVAETLGLSRSSIYEWLRWYREGDYEALETFTAPGSSPLVTAEMDLFLEMLVLESDPTHHGYETV